MVDPRPRQTPNPRVAQNPSIDGLTKWTQLDRSLVDRSLVVWHIFGLTHMPRPEDWPVMPVETCGFALSKPPKKESFLVCLKAGTALH